MSGVRRIQEHGDAGRARDDLLEEFEAFGNRAGIEVRQAGARDTSAVDVAEKRHGQDSRASTRYWIT